MMITKAPVVESENHLRDYRTIGVGIQGMADILAREWKTYEDLDFITEVCERIQYGCVRESIQMAKEYTPYPKFKGSRWDVGDIFDEYHKNSVCPDLDWLELKQLCKQHGIYNSQLTSPAPNTSTSLFMMASAGFMPHYAEYFYEELVTLIDCYKYHTVYIVVFALTNLGQDKHYSYGIRQRYLQHPNDCL